jgi:hypothetical protein
VRHIVIATLTLAATAEIALATPSSRTPDDVRQPRTANLAADVPSFDCNSLWEPTTHMTKQQWARACVRVYHRLKEIEAIEDGASRLPKD